MKGYSCDIRRRVLSYGILQLARFPLYVRIDLTLEKVLTTTISQLPLTKKWVRGLHEVGIHYRTGSTPSSDILSSRCSSASFIVIHTSWRSSLAFLQHSSWAGANLRLRVRMERSVGSRCTLWAGYQRRIAATSWVRRQGGLR